jgi:propionyl-CoA carboxylase alpha chain
MREQLFDAARAAAKAIGYSGAGTVEFLADEDGRFFFLEMNTRLQVEHPVTECTTGLDLVALQIEVARGARLAEHPPAPQGHSIEVRLYAEDPAHDWQPQSGIVHRIDVPGVVTRFRTGAARSGVRLDSGVEDRSPVGIHYDPMLAKVISWAPTRSDAAQLLAAALARASLHGVRTNRDLLVNVLRHPAFRAGDTDTAFFDRHGLDQLAAPLVDAAGERVAALAAALALDAGAARVLPGVPSGWRNVPSQPQRAAFDGPSGRHDVAYRITRNGLDAVSGIDGIDGIALVAAGAERVVLDVSGVRRSYAIARYGDEVYVDTPAGSVALRIVERFPDPAAHVSPGSLLAPMPGSVVRLAVVEGDTVVAGQPILWLEAMKMQHQINAPADGVVAELAVREGQQVDVGAVLAVVRNEGEQE